jgi:hypothetical protein
LSSRQQPINKTSPILFGQALFKAINKLHHQKTSRSANLHTSGTHSSQHTHSPKNREIFGAQWIRRFFHFCENSTGRRNILMPAFHSVKRDLSDDLPLSVRLEHPIAAAPDIAVWGAFQTGHELPGTATGQYYFRSVLFGHKALARPECS